jgi:hypothetical protein
VNKDTPTEVVFPAGTWVEGGVRYAVLICSAGMTGKDPNYNAASQYNRYTVYRKEQIGLSEYAGRCDITGDRTDGEPAINYNLYMLLKLRSVNPVQKPRPHDIILPETAYIIDKGEMLPLHFSVKDKDGIDYTGSLPVSITSSNAKVTGISGGSIVGISKGKSVVFIQCGEIVRKINVQVRIADLLVANRMIGASNMAIARGKTAQVNYVVHDVEKRLMSKETPVYAIENSAVAEVSKTGLVTAKAVGEAMMTVSSPDRKMIKYVTISVYDEETETLVTPANGMVITKSVRFKPGVYTLSDGIVIAADNITVDGNGAIICRSSKPGNSENGTGFGGTGITMTGRNNVTIKNITAKGYDRGLYVKGGDKLTLQNNNFSDNYNFSSFGWGDGPRKGAMILEDMYNSVVKYNNGNNCWIGIELCHSDNNFVHHNDFAICHSVPLKLWGASFNEIEDNNFTWGVRVDPGEAHARDSAGAMLEGASMFNFFSCNDFSYGGDGIYTRWNHGCFPMGNYWLENEIGNCWNNAVESQCPGNTYVRNNIYNSSYGMWISYSDFTTVAENKYWDNGGRNAVWYGAGGITVNGNSTHYLIMNNVIEFNNGHGVGISSEDGETKEIPFNHLIQNNVLSNNSSSNGRGLFVNKGRAINLFSNTFENNQMEDIGFTGGTLFTQVNNTTDAGGTGRIPNPLFSMPTLSVSANPVQADYTLEDMYSDKIPKKICQADYSGLNKCRYISVRQGVEITFTADGADPMDSNLNYRWEFGDGTWAGFHPTLTSPVVKHTFDKAGIYRVGVMIDNGILANLQGIVVTVVPNGTEIGTEGNANLWSISGGNGATVSNTPFTVDGNIAIQVKNYANYRPTTGPGDNFSLVYPSTMDLNGLNGAILSFELKSVSEYRSNDSNSPRVRLYKDEGNYIQYNSIKDYLTPFAWGNEVIQAHHYGFQHLEIDLYTSNKYFTRSVEGLVTPDEVKWIEFYGGQGRGWGTYTFDGLKLLERNTK